MNISLSLSLYIYIYIHTYITGYRVERPRIPEPRSQDDAAAISISYTLPDVFLFRKLASQPASLQILVAFRPSIWPGLQEAQPLEDESAAIVFICFISFS